MANKRRGLQRLSCHWCSSFVYTTWAQAERHGMPSCACGERFEPDDFELGIALGLDECASVVEYRRALASAYHGQAGPAHRYGSEHLRSPDEIACIRVEKARRERSLIARLERPPARQRRADAVLKG